MILLKGKENIVFVHIPKNAGKYIEKLLVQNDKVKKQTLTHDGIKCLNDNYQFFAIIRKPHEFYVSYYNYACQYNVQNNKNDFFSFVFNKNLNNTINNILNKNSNDIINFSYGYNKNVKMDLFNIMNRLDIGFFTSILISMLTRKDLNKIKKEDLKNIFDELFNKNNLKLFDFNSVKSGEIVNYLNCSKNIDSVNVSKKIEIDLNQDVRELIHHKDRYVYSLLDKINKNNK